MDFSFDYGGDSWNYDGCEIRAVKTDEHGNWTERMVYVDGQPIFKMCIRDSPREERGERCNGKA